MEGYKEKVKNRSKKLFSAGAATSLLLTVFLMGAAAWKDGWVDYGALSLAVVSVLFAILSTIDAIRHSAILKHDAER